MCPANASSAELLLRFERSSQQLLSLSCLLAVELQPLVSGRHRRSEACMQVDLLCGSKQTERHCRPTSCMYIDVLRGGKQSPQHDPHGSGRPKLCLLINWGTEPVGAASQQLTKEAALKTPDVRHLMSDLLSQNKQVQVL